MNEYPRGEKMDSDWGKMIDEAFDQALQNIRSKRLQPPPLESNKDNSLYKKDDSLSKDIFPIKKPDSNLLELGRWLNIIRHPVTILIVGSRGSGKSALGYKLLEYLKHWARPYIVALPQKARRYLPEWIGSVPSLEDIPLNSIALIDESFILFHARASSSQRAEALSNLINLSRQRSQTMIFVSQEGRQIDINIVSSASIIIFKNPSILQLEFERKQMRRIAEEAHRMFAAINDRDKNKWAYVYAPGSNFIGILENSLPSFWTPSLSKAYVDHDPVIQINLPKKMTREEKIKKAKELRRQGLSLSEIAKILGVTKSTVKNYLDGYPYRRKLRFSL
jgi:hypothetical protein